MPMWRCPHCGTPQSETSRCWVCKRSSTSCGTCRHFRRSIAGQLGYCGLDPRRLPLRGDEMRGCWEAPPPADVAEPSRIRIAPSPTRARRATEAPTASSGRIDFIPVGAAPWKRERRPLHRRRTAAARAPDPPVGFWGDDP